MYNLFVFYLRRLDIAILSHWFCYASFIVILCSEILLNSHEDENNVYSDPFFSCCFKL